MLCGWQEAAGSGRCLQTPSSSRPTRVWWLAFTGNVGKAPIFEDRGEGNSFRLKNEVGGKAVRRLQLLSRKTRIRLVLLPRQKTGKLLLLTLNGRTRQRAAGASFYYCCSQFFGVIYLCSFRDSAEGSPCCRYKVVNSWSRCMVWCQGSIFILRWRHSENSVVLFCCAAAKLTAGPGVTLVPVQRE